MGIDRPTKISFGDMRAAGVHGLLIYCADYRCSQSIAISGDTWPDNLGLSDLQPHGLTDLAQSRHAKPGLRAKEGSARR